MENLIENKRARAKERIKELKGFYGHLAAYLAVNTFITGSKIITNIGDGETFSEAFFDLGTFFIWGAWGIGLAFHAAKTFGFSVFNKAWEERQIQKYMEEDRRDAEKYSKPFSNERKRLS